MIHVTQEANKNLNGASAARLAFLCREIERARVLASRTEEILDAVACELQDMIGHHSLNLAKVTNSLGGLRQRHGLLPKSSQNVASVVLVPGIDGSVTARIDGRSGIPLSPLLAALLEILKADGGVTGDHLVGWKSVAAIQSALKEPTKQHHSKAAIKELVYRLRSLLGRHGENPFLVQSHRHLGYRFAVEREPKAESDNQ